MLEVWCQYVTSGTYERSCFDACANARMSSGENRTSFPILIDGIWPSSCQRLMVCADTCHAAARSSTVHSSALAESAFMTRRPSLGVRTWRALLRRPFERSNRAIYPRLSRAPEDRLASRPGPRNTPVHALVFLVSVFVPRTAYPTLLRLLSSLSHVSRHPWSTVHHGWYMLAVDTQDVAGGSACTDRGVQRADTLPAPVTVAYNAENGYPTDIHRRPVATGSAT